MLVFYLTFHILLKGYFEAALCDIISSGCDIDVGMLLGLLIMTPQGNSLEAGYNMGI